METGIVSETKYNKTRKMEIRTSVVATCNNVEKIIEPLQSRFFIVKMQAYTYEQFYEITLRLLSSSRFNVDEEIAKSTAIVVWSSSFEKPKQQPRKIVDKEGTCLFTPTHPIWKPDPQGKCPKGWGTNEVGQCFPMYKKCPAGYWRADDDESGANRVCDQSERRIKKDLSYRDSFLAKRFATFLS